MGLSGHTYLMQGWIGGSEGFTQTLSIAIVAGLGPRPDVDDLAGRGRPTLERQVGDDRPGTWMYHCHILEHHASGMMGHFEVI